LRALKREIKMSREGKVKRKICVWKRKKEKWKVKKNICVCMREWKRVIEKEKENKERRGVARKIWEGSIKWENKNKKVQGRMSRCWEAKLSFFFPTMCNPTMWTSSVPRSHIFFSPCTCPPFYIFSSLISAHMDYFSWSLALKGKQPLEGVLVWQYLCWMWWPYL
jgi:hypothetical protein